MTTAFADPIRDLPDLAHDDFADALESLTSGSLPRAVGSPSGTTEGSAVDLTTIEAARELGVTPRRVRQYIADGRLKARLAGRDYLISRRSLAAFKRRPPGRPPAGES